MKREAKIGLFAVLMIGVAWGGIRFLQGFDILSRNADYYASYDQVSGVQIASPIMMKGVKIGSVTEIKFDPAVDEKVTLQLTISRNYRIPADSEARIFSDGIMGGKAIEISYGSSSEYLEDGDTLRAQSSRDLMDMASSELEYFKSVISDVTGELTTTLSTINRLMESNEKSINGTLSNLNSLSGDMADVLRAEKQNLSRAIGDLTTFTNSMAAAAPRIDSLVGGANRIVTQLSEEEFAARLTETVGGLNEVLARLQSNEGSLGMLMNDTALYDSLTMASGNLAALLEDMKLYPGRYIHLSVFGRDADKMKAKADRRAARAEKRSNN